MHNHGILLWKRKQYTVGQDSVKEFSQLLKFVSPPPPGVAGHRSYRMVYIWWP